MADAVRERSGGGTAASGREAARPFDLSGAEQRAAGERPLLYVVGQLRAGGQERQLFYLLRELVASGRAAHIAVWNFDPGEAWVEPIRALPVPVHDLGGPGGRAGKILRLRRLARETRAGLLHSYGFYTNFAAWAASLGTAAVPVGSIRSTLADARRDSGALLGLLSSRWPRHQVANSRGAARESRRLSWIAAPSRVDLVRNGVDLEKFAATPMPSGVPLLLGIGSLVAIKRWERFLEAAVRLAASGLEFKAAIAGEGPLRAWLAGRIRRERLDDRFSLLGGVQDVPRLLAQASVLVHTSDVEGCPNAVIEAMACARPVVAWNAGDVAEIVEPERTGYVVSDEEALASRLSLLVGDRGLRKRLGDAARERAQRDFELPRLLSETLAAYRAAGWRG